jgi:DNA polymerase III sliding clamp (beta) subunit (PCNA family)
VEIGFNAQYLLDFLRAVSTEKSLPVQGPHSAGELRPGGESRTTTATYVVMPMSI